VRFFTAKARFEVVSELAFDRTARDELVEAFIVELGGQDGLVAEFDERLCFPLVDHATFYSEIDVRFMFKNGMEITQSQSSV